MRLEAIDLVAFRCWESLAVRLPAGSAALVGPNGCGKTAVLEAVWYLAALTSHRSASDAALVRRGADAAVVRAEVLRHGRSERIEVEIRTAGRARARRGGAPVVRRREILGAVRAQVFAPERLAVIRGDPGDRRRFADEVLVQLHPRYHGVIGDYERALRQRNALLKDAAARGRPPAGLEAWDEALVTAGAALCAGREDALARIAPAAAAAYGRVGDGGELSLSYRSSVPGPEGVPGPEAGRPPPGGAAGPAGGPPAGAPRVPERAEAWAESMRARLAERRRDEMVRGVSLVGPHRDEVAIALDGMPARSHASFGEGWMAALALVLGAQDALADAVGEPPVLLLDDPFTPLDPSRRQRLAAALPESTQILCTAADPAELPGGLEAARLRVDSKGVHG